MALMFSCARLNWQAYKARCPYEDDHFALLVLVAVLVLLLLRKYNRLEFVGHASLLQKTWSVKLGAIGALVGMWAQSFPDAALHAWAVLPPDIKTSCRQTLWH